MYIVVELKEKGGEREELGSRGGTHALRGGREFFGASFSEAKSIFLLFENGWRCNF